MCVFIWFVCDSCEREGCCVFSSGLSVILVREKDVCFHLVCLSDSCEREGCCLFSSGLSVILVREKDVLCFHFQFSLLKEEEI